MGSRTWPDGNVWQWTIDVSAPTTVYIWVLDLHNGGISSAPSGWMLRYSDRPVRDIESGKLYSKYVTTGSVQIDVQGLLVAGAFTAPCGGNHEPKVWIFKKGLQAGPPKVTSQ